MENKRRPILHKGEVYSKPIQKSGGGSLKVPEISFDEARTKIINDIDTATSKIRSLPSNKRMPNELVLCVRMHPDFSAKSYYPETIFTGDSSDSLQEIGSRMWRSVVSEDKSLQIGKLFFVRTTDIGLSRFKQNLNRSESSFQKKFIVDIRRLSTINLLSETEQILGFSSDWEMGRIEAVIHPLEIDETLALKRFIGIAQNAGANMTSLRQKQYSGGITFISMWADREIINALAGYNPLRTIHPMQMRQFPVINRAAPMKGLPKNSPFTGVPPIKLGIIDGGYKQSNSYLDKYVEIVNSVPGESFEDGIEHGTHTTSAALFGPINNLKNSDQLPEPPISVRNFRVLSKSNYEDPDLYESIDAIEEIVATNKDLSVYAINFGPEGPILDDHISRFTFTIDKLSYEYDVLFCTAIGNNGEVIGYNRIQSPSDAVNGLGVGAYTINDGTKIRASYSCLGPGREGNKLKPDIMGFGGCERVPIQLVSAIDGHRAYTMGTSFASPPVAAAAAQLIGGSKKIIRSLVARTLLIHSAESEEQHNPEMGHGTLPDDLSNIISCEDKSYTLIFNAEIDPTKYVEYTIPWVPGIEKGKVKFSWTIAVLTKVDPLSPDDYTASSIETSFYPNSKKFKFYLGDKAKPKKTCVVDIENEPYKVMDLINQGWNKSEFPVSKSGPLPYADEHDLKADLKWDSIDHRTKTIVAKDIKSPMFHVHALNRGHRNRSSKVKFAIVITVSAPKAEVDLYSKIIANYPALVPLKVAIKTSVPVTA